MLTYDPDKRLTAVAAAGHAWLFKAKVVIPPPIKEQSNQRS
jgi:hypothetical protein